MRGKIDLSKRSFADKTTKRVVPNHLKGIRRELSGKRSASVKVRHLGMTQIAYSSSSLYELVSYPKSIEN